MTDDVSIHSKSQKVLKKSAEKSVLYATTKVRKSIKSLKIHHLKTTCQKIWNQENVNQWVINYHLKMCSNEHNAAYNHAWLCSIHFTNLSLIWATFEICGMFILIMGLCSYSKLRNSNLQKFLKRNWIIGKLPQASSTAEPPLRLLHLRTCKYSKCQLLEIHFELKEIHFEVIEIQFEQKYSLKL